MNQLSMSLIIVLSVDSMINGPLWLLADYFVVLLLPLLEVLGNIVVRVPADFVEPQAPFLKKK